MDFVRKRLTFFNWVLLVVALALGIIYATWLHLPQNIFAAELPPHMSIIISALILISVLHMGKLSWELDETTVEDMAWRASFDWWLPMGILFCGIVGTTAGIYFQGHAMIENASFEALATSVQPTMFAAGGAFGISFLLDVNLMYGIGKVRSLRDANTTKMFEKQEEAKFFAAQALLGEGK